MASDKNLNEMIKHVVANYEGSILTRTKLVKLLYLADRKAKEDIGNKISNTTYFKYHYGPYSDDIINSINELKDITIEEKSGISSKGRYYNYSILRESEGSDLSPDEMAILNSIIDEYSRYNTDTLVEKVYEIGDIEQKEKYSILL